MLASLLLLVAAACSSASSALWLGDRPNVVFILTDDLSMNLVPYLPNVLRMERDGTTMSRFYVVDSLCCPSRAATLTGEYPHNNGVIKNGGSGGGYPAFETHADELKTFGLTMQQAGYRTGFIGKYLNGYHGRVDPPAPGWSVWDGVGNGYHEFHYAINENGRPKWYGGKPRDYLTDVLAGKATGFINTARAADKPFMLEVATFAPHAPYVPAPRYRHADPWLRLPRTPAFDRLPTNPPS